MGPRRPRLYDAESVFSSCCCNSVHSRISGAFSWHISSPRFRSAYTCVGVVVHPPCPSPCPCLHMPLSVFICLCLLVSFSFCLCMSASKALETITHGFYSPSPSSPLCPPSFPSFGLLFSLPYLLPSVTLRPPLPTSLLSEQEQSCLTSGSLALYSRQ